MADREALTSRIWQAIPEPHIVSEDLAVISFAARRMRISFMAIFLRQDLVSRLIHDRYAGGVDELASKWEGLAATRPGFPSARGRASIYRWLDDGVPTRGADAGLHVFGLCALLDVDLLSIFDYERNGYFSKFAKLRQLIYARASSVGGLATFMAMYRPGDNWPSDAIASACYGRRWFAYQFTNEDAWQSNDYVLVKVVSVAPVTR